jgi:hypothetical protein
MSLAPSLLAPVVLPPGGPDSRLLPNLSLVCRIKWLIDDIMLSRLEGSATGRRTAADYPTAAEAHGFDPSVSELLDTEFRKVDG